VACPEQARCQGCWHICAWTMVTMSLAFKLIGAIVVLVGSFFLTLAALDYFGRSSVQVPRLIKIEEATYGSNCGRRVGTGNATQFLAKACDGHPSCNVVICVTDSEIRHRAAAKTSTPASCATGNNRDTTST
jgi:hypothetical protein